jgi:hypothetical protein
MKPNDWWLVLAAVLVVILIFLLFFTSPEFDRPMSRLASSCRSSED